jgi:hypothetical protein
METFYSTLSGICFTLLGLWWVVVQMNLERWMSTPARRLTAAAASMHFTAPGLIALVAVMVPEENQIWRVGAVVGGILGLLVSAYALFAATLTRGQRIQEALMVILFGLITGLAFVTTPVFGLRPIVVEALVDVAMLGGGVYFIWLLFLEGQPADSVVGS